MKSKITNYMLCVVLPCFLLSNCKKELKNTVITAPLTSPVSAPGSFVVKVIDREDSIAVIQWTKSKSADTGKITYTINLNGTTLASGLTDTTYKIFNINDSTQYAGQIIAKNNKGAMTTDTFTVQKNLGYVYASTITDFVCYRLDGSQKWAFPAGIASYPVISHDTVFAQTNVANTTTYNIYALNASNGKKYWSANSVNEAGLGLLYYRGMIYTAYPKSNKIVALNALTGQQVWEFVGAGAYMPSISKGMLFCSTSVGLGGTLYALDAKTGLQKWTYKTVSFAGVPTAKDGTVFLQTSSRDQTSAALGNFYALDANTGSVKWTFSYTGGIGVNYQVRPVVVGDAVYFIANQNVYGQPNTLYALNMVTGVLLWNKVVYRGSLYDDILGNSQGIFVTDDDNLTKYDLTTGNSLWSINYPFSSSVNESDITLLPYSICYHFLQKQTRFTQYNIYTSAFINSPLFSLSTFGGYVIVLNGVAYYPFSSGMSSIN